MAANLVLIGFKSCGKSTVGRLIARDSDFRLVDLDDVIESLYADQHGQRLSCRELYQQAGREVFREVETAALKQLAGENGIVLSTGGGAPMTEANQPLLKAIGAIVYLHARPEILAARFSEQGWPAFLQPRPSLASLTELWEARHRVYEQLADHEIRVGARRPEEISAEILAAWPNLS